MNEKQKIKDLIQKGLGQEIILTEDDYFVDLKETEINSFKFIKIVIEIENELNIELFEDDYDVKFFKTLNEFVDHVYDIMMS